MGWHGMACKVGDCVGGLVKWKGYGSVGGFLFAGVGQAYSKEHGGVSVPKLKRAALLDWAAAY